VKVVITDRATTDMRLIGRWIKRDNPSRALTFVQELRQRCHAIGSRPRMYPLLEGFEVAGIRRCNHQKYLIFYKIENDTVRILHVLHGARDIAAIIADVIKH
jgi:toxin ParE1/3/4